MEEPYRLGAWHIQYEPDRPEPAILDAQNQPVATVHGADDLEMLTRALLIAKAPSLRDAGFLAWRSFQVIAANDWGRASEVARELLPYFETVMYGLTVEKEEPGA